MEYLKSPDLNTKWHHHHQNIVDTSSTGYSSSHIGFQSICRQYFKRKMQAAEPAGSFSSTTYHHTTGNVGVAINDDEMDQFREENRSNHWQPNDEQGLSRWKKRFIQPLLGLLYKKAMILRHDWKSFIYVVMLPIMLITLTSISLFGSKSLYADIINPNHVGTTDYYQWFLDNTAIRYLGTLERTSATRSLLVNVLGGLKRRYTSSGENNLLLLFNNTYVTTTKLKMEGLDPLIDILSERLSSYVSFPVGFKTFYNKEELDKTLLEGTYLGGFEFHKLDFDNSLFNVTVLYNETVYGTLPQLTQIVQQSIFDILNIGNQNQSKIKSIFPSVGIQAIPLGTPLTWMFLDNIIYSLILCLIFLIPTIVIGVVSEEEKETKIQLFLSSVSKEMYWFSHFIFDFTIFLLVSIPQIIFIGWIGGAAALLDNNAIAVFGLYILYGCYVVSFCYLFTYLFKTVEDAQSKFHL